MILRLLIPALLAVAHAFAAEPVFEFKDGDRVALIGDAFIEREQYEGWIELAATTRFADHAVTFRNLGWSADTVAVLSTGAHALATPLPGTAPDPSEPTPVGPPGNAEPQLGESAAGEQAATGNLPKPEKRARNPTSTATGAAMIARL